MENETARASGGRSGQDADGWADIEAELDVTKKALQEAALDIARKGSDSQLEAEALQQEVTRLNQEIGALRDETMRTAAEKLRHDQHQEHEIIQVKLCHG